MINLKILRAKNNLTQKELGEILGKSKQYISLLEKGQRPIPDKILKKLKELKINDEIDDITADIDPFTVIKEYWNVTDEQFKLLNKGIKENPEVFVLFAKAWSGDEKALVAIRKFICKD
jgi:transcriptional regulator with XRE-family HTH domain